MNIESLLNPDLRSHGRHVVPPSQPPELPLPALVKRLLASHHQPTSSNPMNSNPPPTQSVLTPSPSPPRVTNKMTAIKEGDAVKKPLAIKQINPSPKTNSKTEPVFIEGEPIASVNYPPHEVERFSEASGLQPRQRRELIEQCGRFKVYPTGTNGQLPIASYPRHIPFNGGSDKNKKFNNNTGRYAVDIFVYTFVMPDDPGQIKHQVMWDYHNGLVRTTAFFKSLRFSKTATRRAISKNTKQLETVTFSLTGGNLGGQGYWFPFACARAMCLTFCYDIRWVLAPLFGPEFPFECQPPNESTKWAIPDRLIHEACRTQEGWKAADSRGNRTTDPPFSITHQTFPKPKTDQGPMVGRKQLRPRRAITRNDSFVESPSPPSSHTDDKPIVADDSDDDEYRSEDEEVDEVEAYDDGVEMKVKPFPATKPFTFKIKPNRSTSSPISPKTSVSSPGWTSVNRPKVGADLESVADAATTTTTMITTPVVTPDKYTIHRIPESIKRINPATLVSSSSSPTPPPTAIHRGRKRACSPSPGPFSAATSTTNARRRVRSPSHSESDDQDIPLPVAAAAGMAATAAASKLRGEKKIWTEREIEAAQALVLLKAAAVIL